MPAGFQLVIDCKDPERLARFWAADLGYVLEPPPKGSLPGTTGGAISGFPTVSWESARTASSIPAVTAPASGSI
jgi:hypothetical protein